MNFNKIREDAWNYLRESKNYIYLSALIFVFFILFGFFASSKLGFIDEILKNIISKVSLLQGFDVALFIFANNTQAALVGLIAGIFLGILPIINLVSNGTVVGYVFARVAQEIGFSQFWKILPHGIFELPAIFIALGLGIKLGFSFFIKDRLRDPKYYASLFLCAVTSIFISLIISIPLTFFINAFLDIQSYFFLVSPILIFLILGLISKLLIISNLKYCLYRSMLVFLLIILPLLLLAAFIEGMLIDVLE